MTSEITEMMAERDRLLLWKDVIGAKPEQRHSVEDCLALGAINSGLLRIQDALAACTGEGGNDDA
jgi:hypothetical protein